MNSLVIIRRTAVFIIMNSEMCTRDAHANTVISIAECARFERVKIHIYFGRDEVNGKF